MNQPSTFAPAQPGVVYLQAPSTGKGFAVAAITLGVVGAVIGLVPILGLFAIPMGILAFIFGLVGVRRAKRVQAPKALARAGWILGVVAVGFGVLGAAIVDQAIDDLDDCFEGSTAACERLQDDEVNL
jgi:hypothetical protein